MENEVDSPMAPAVWISEKNSVIFDKYNLSALLYNPTIGLAITKLIGPLQIISELELLLYSLWTFLILKHWCPLPKKKKQLSFCMTFKSPYLTNTIVFTPNTLTCRVSNKALLIKFWFTEKIKLRFRPEAKDLTDWWIFFWQFSYCKTIIYEFVAICMDHNKRCDN